jgi:hypothetical protein
MAHSCPDCGLTVPEGAPDCQAMFDALCARQPGPPFTYPIRRMMVDAYALQHPGRYCASAKSLFAHLTGMCAALEHGSHPTVLEAQRRRLDGTPRLEKPALPAARGALTIAEPYAARDAVSLVAALERWARCTWEAYAPLHPVARQWTEAALRHR